MSDPMGSARAKAPTRRIEWQRWFRNEGKTLTLSTEPERFCPQRRFGAKTIIKVCYVDITWADSGDIPKVTCQLLSVHHILIER